MTQSGRRLRSLTRSQEAMRRLFRIKRDIAAKVSLHCHGYDPS